VPNGNTLQAAMYTNDSTAPTLNQFTVDMGSVITLAFSESVNASALSQLYFFS